MSGEKSYSDNNSETVLVSMIFLILKKNLLSSFTWESTNSVNRNKNVLLFSNLSKTQKIKGSDRTENIKKPRPKCLKQIRKNFFDKNKEKKFFFEDLQNF